jgi:hypothetical protein
MLQPYRLPGHVTGTASFVLSKSLICHMNEPFLAQALEIVSSVAKTGGDIQNVIYYC